MRQVSPVGGSTLITSAPKSDRITAAPGPATKLARSTTFKPEKILSLVIGFSWIVLCVGFGSPSVELRRALCEEGRCALLLVLGRRAETEVGGFELHALALARVHALVCRLERELDGDGSVGRDLREDSFGPRDQIGRRNDLINKPD